MSHCRRRNDAWQLIEIGKGTKYFTHLQMELDKLPYGLDKVVVLNCRVRCSDEKRGSIMKLVALNVAPSHASCLILPSCLCQQSL